MNNIDMERFNEFYNDLLGKIPNIKNPIAIVMNKKTSDKFGEEFLNNLKRTKNVEIIISEYVDDDIVYALPLGLPILPFKECAFPNITFGQEDRIK